ncbi:MAG: MliC family protein [Kiritimatiellia bacterium]|jgi:hypothetical protein|nr:MliC family protein [Kiritimatiellia bacterium]
MSTPCPSDLRHHAAAPLARLLALTLLCGCASLRFDTTRKARFIDMDSQILRVEYGEEKRTETLPNGLVCTFEGKVRLRLPADGSRVTLYQAISASGVRYVSEDKRLEFIEKGPYCIVRQNGRTIFEGVYCRP